MAQRKPAKRPAQRGSMLYGVLTGLLIGLVVAAGVAFYVTRAPVPFVDHATREPDQKPLPDARHAPDPNSGLYGRDGAAGTAPSGPTATTPAPVPGVQPAAPPPAQPPDDLGALIATLPSTPGAPAARSGTAEKPAGEKPAEKTNDKPAAKTAEKPAAKAPAAVASNAPSSPAKEGKDKEANGKYFLQAGAYRGAEEAEALKARIILLGLPVSVQRAEVNGKPINRVRVGPFNRLDDMNRARTRLGENKIEVAVVRQ